MRHSASLFAVSVLSMGIGLSTVSYEAEEQPVQPPDASTAASTNEQPPADTSHQASGEWPGLRSEQIQRPVGIIFKSGPSYGFSTSIHADVLTGLSNHHCTKILGNAQWNQDILNFNISDAHFDNCAFEESLAYIQKRLAEVQTQVVAYEQSDKKNPELIDEAIKSLGQAIHGIQDFYSHSNYVEYAASAKLSQEAAMRLKLWDLGARERLRNLADTQKLVTGVVFYETPKRCAPGALGHSDLNKDSKTSTVGKAAVEAAWAANRTHHMVAVDWARHASIQFLRHAFTKWQVLDTYCQSQIGVGVTFDARHHE
ncbi:MAG TPA: HET-C-related protein [Archangium sp.]|nr:HET-C-related protein [Archangium sp.]